LHARLTWVWKQRGQALSNTISDSCSAPSPPTTRRCRTTNDAPSATSNTHRPTTDRGPIATTTNDATICTIATAETVDAAAMRRAGRPRNAS